MSVLFVVGTPIGNLADVTERALSVLRTVSVILCEDTRQTGKLLARHGIATPTLSYHQHSRLSRTVEIVDRLRTGESLALVTDAGTPGIADPGNRLVSQVVAALGDRVSVVSVPGPAALTAALSISGLPTDRFRFLGFLPHKKGRQTMFSEIAESTETVAFYESPHRIMKTLTSLAALLPATRPVVVCRELTKVHESVVRGSAAEILTHFTSHPDQIRGEFVVIVGST